MKILGYVLTIVGFFLLAGLAGSSDFYEECRAAADCVAGEPMSYTRMLMQGLFGIVLFGVGILVVVENDQ